MLSSLMSGLAALVDAVARDGLDEDAHAISDALADDVRLAVEVTAGSVDVVEALGSLTVLGRVEQLRDIAVTGPVPLDEVHQDEDVSSHDDSVSSGIDRIRHLLTGSDS
jgi:hypothetical protein